MTGQDVVFDLLQPVAHIVDVDPLTADREKLFGGDGRDAMSVGRDSDILMGGHGDDDLDVRPSGGDRQQAQRQNCGSSPGSPAWFTWAFPENSRHRLHLRRLRPRCPAGRPGRERARSRRPSRRLGGWTQRVLPLPGRLRRSHDHRDRGAARPGLLRDLTRRAVPILVRSGARRASRPRLRVPNSEADSPAPHPVHARPLHLRRLHASGRGRSLPAPWRPLRGRRGRVGCARWVSLDRVAAYVSDGGPFAIDDAASATPTISAAGLDDGLAVIGLEVDDGAGTYDSDRATARSSTPRRWWPSIRWLRSLRSVRRRPHRLGHRSGCARHTLGDCRLGRDHLRRSPGSGCTIGSTNGAGTITGSHPYTAIGDYPVVVTVVDDDGGWAHVHAAGRLVTLTGVPVTVETATTWSTTDPWPIADPLTFGGRSYTRVARSTCSTTQPTTSAAPLLFRSRSLPASTRPPVPTSVASRRRSTSPTPGSPLILPAVVSRMRRHLDERRHGPRRHPHRVQRRPPLRTGVTPGRHSIPVDSRMH